MPPVSQDPRVEEWFATQGRSLGPLATAARALLDDGLPGARHAIKWSFPTWIGKGTIAALQPRTDHVNVQFYRGSSLPDPDRVLEGTGKDLRHVKLRHAKDARTPAVKALVRAAWRLDQQGGA